MGELADPGDEEHPPGQRRWESGVHQSVGDRIAAVADTAVGRYVRQLRLRAGRVDAERSQVGVLQRLHCDAA